MASQTLLYLAPMEGVTGYIARNAFATHFGGFDKYFTPFIPEGKGIHKKTLRDLAPENNPGIELVPQILGNHAEETLALARRLAAHNFTEININLGCPSGTVAPKGRGSGFLAYPDELEYFLDQLFSSELFSSERFSSERFSSEPSDSGGSDISSATTPTGLRLSVKTRVGYEDAANWDRIMDIYHKYPSMSELIIHPRTRKDMYIGPVRMQHFDEAVARFADIPVSLCYNGDIKSVADYLALKAKYPMIDRYMIGRGAFAKPGLAAAIAAIAKMDAANAACSEVTLTPFGPWTEAEYCSKLRAFHDDIMQTYQALYHAPKDTLFRMKEIWFYLHESFVDCEKPLKKIRKCQSLEEYLFLVDHVFKELELMEL